MESIVGITVSDGIAVGVAVIVGSVERDTPELQVARGRVPREIERFDVAVREVAADIEELRERTKATLGGDAGSIINTYLMFLQDEVSILRPIRNLISEGCWEAASAVVRRFRDLMDELRGLPEPLPSRIPDLLDIQRRLVDKLQGVEPASLSGKLPKNSVIIADDLTPTQTATLDRQRVIGFATAHGGPASHTAILARHLGIPALIGLGSGLGRVASGTPVIVDGFHQRLVVEPGAPMVRNAKARLRRLKDRALRDVGAARTRDGTTFELFVNIDSDESVKELNSLGIAGVGLHRTEYLYLGRDHTPGEEEQTAHYTRILKAMAPKPVVIRTMDFGSDKWDPRIHSLREPNPALGLRSLRLSFAYGEIFKTQLRALLRASVHGSAHILFPMVSDAEEFARARACLTEAATGLRAEGVRFREEVPTGAMLELPVTALVGESLFAAADFISIGSNDLIQYTLAVDRTNRDVADLFIPHHPGVLKLLHMAAETARRSAKPITVCGEMAGMGLYTPVLLGLGLTRLSMAPSRVRDVVDEARRCEDESSRALVRAMLEAPGPESAGRILRAHHEVRRRTTRRG